MKVFHVSSADVPSNAQSCLPGGQVGVDGMVDGYNAAAGSVADAQAGQMQSASILGGHSGVHSVVLGGLMCSLSSYKTATLFPRSLFMCMVPFILYV